MLGKMKQLMEMKKQADKIKKELDASNVEVKEVIGITMVMTGSQNIRSIEIDETLLNSNNKKRIEADLVRSFNAAVKKSQKVAAQKMQAVMPGFPGL